eukprot:COSAG01_NODE_1883_length_8988_cov_67.877264_10_plen_171_part_00
MTNLGRKTGICPIHFATPGGSRVQPYRIWEGLPSAPRHASVTVPKPHDTLVAHKIMLRSAPNLHAGVSRPSVWKYDQVICPMLVMPKIIFATSINAHISNCRKVRTSVIVINERKEGAGMSNCRTIENEVMGDLRQDEVMGDCTPGEVTGDLTCVHSGTFVGSPSSPLCM